MVYATSEPHEALLLGGHIATMREGRVTQFGPTAGAYRRPETIDTARVFSDPPINVSEVTKRGGTLSLGSHAQWPASGPAAEMADGRYRLAIRPHHVTPERPGAWPTGATVSRSARTRAGS